ncbi:unnamed protein product [Rotaria sp. Silwood2]|nr:unnamed protein product [Rotaria sp. Silwood2]
MKLVETLQKAVLGRPITNEYIDNVCARLDLTRLHESMFIAPDSARLGMDDPLTEKIDYGKIKRDIVHISTSSREKTLLFQALRWKLTKAKTDFKCEKILECFIGCRSDIEQRTKIIKQLSSKTTDNNTYYVNEERVRLINTIVSLRKDRNYLTSNESLIICMQKASMSESSDIHIKQHLLATLQKLCLKYRNILRSVQSLLINQNTIKWLIPLLTEQTITVHSTLLIHPNHEEYLFTYNIILKIYFIINRFDPYVNSSLYSILILKSIRDKTMQLEDQYTTEADLDLGVIN